MKKNSHKKDTKKGSLEKTNLKSKSKKGSSKVSIKMVLTITLLIVAIFCILVYIFVNKKKEKIVDEVNESIIETINVEESSSQEIPSYQTIPSGTYFDNISKRATMNVSFSDGIYYFEVNWSNSASENMKWEFSGKYDKIENAVIYSNSNCIYEIYDDDGNVEESVIFKNGEGIMEYKDKMLCWLDYNTDKADDQEYNGIFELPKELE